jgi:catechol 2,3-dioxygenase-like lactoylglutathione lyase family enzyme
MLHGISHLTFITGDLDRMEEILTTVFAARKIYDSGDATFSRSKERFFLLGEGTEPIWVAIMEGEPLATRTYNHIAFRIDDADYEAYLERVRRLGLQILDGRPRVAGEGQSIYFYDDDNHLFELHTGTLAERLKRYAAGPSLDLQPAQD